MNTVVALCVGILVVGCALSPEDEGPVPSLDEMAAAPDPGEDELGDPEVWSALSDPESQSAAVDVSPAAACTNGTWSWRWVGYCDSVCFECLGLGGHRGGRNLRDRKYYCAYGAWYATNTYRCRRQCGLCSP